ncbi:MAG: RDD family protein [Chloroflexota bacterium]
MSAQRAALTINFLDGSTDTAELPEEPGQPFVIGLARDCDVQFERSEAYNFISDRHCNITRRTDGRYQIMDGSPDSTPSVLGTYLNGNPVTTTQALLLTDGDIITLGADSSDASDVLVLEFHGATPATVGPGRSAWDIASERRQQRSPYPARQQPTVPSGMQRFELADAITRTVAFVIDNVIIGFVGYIVLLLLTALNPPPDPANFVLQVDYDAAFAEWSFFALGIILVIQTVYHVYFLSQRNGQTPGKAMMGIRVIKADGTPLTVTDALIRNGLGYLASSFFLNMGFLWAFFDQKRRAWHDYLARTYVVRAVPRR